MGNFTPPPTQNEPLKSPPKLGLRKTGNLLPDILAYWSTDTGSFVVPFLSKDESPKIRVLPTQKNG